MSQRNEFEGGCLCGALRYRCATPPLDAGYCHCRLCQRSTGAPVLVWATFPFDRFAYTQGTPALYRSSAHGVREFCATCGTQIAYRAFADARTIDVNVGSLDNPAGVPPRRHVWTASRIPWFDTRDELPRQPGEGSDPA